MYVYNRDIDDFKVGSKAIVEGEECVVTDNTGERVYFGEKYINWLELTDVGLWVN